MNGSHAYMMAGSVLARLLPNTTRIRDCGSFCVQEALPGPYTMMAGDKWKLRRAMDQAMRDDRKAYRRARSQRWDAAPKDPRAMGGKWHRAANVVNARVREMCNLPTADWSFYALMQVMGVGRDELKASMSIYNGF
jgi:hypothetical protein